MYSSVLRRRHSFHRVGIGIAAIVMAAGLALIAAAVVRLDLLETLHSGTFAIVLGFALVALGVLSIASYGVVRAIEWINRR
jgi:hypothetical protein